MSAGQQFANGETDPFVAETRRSSWLMRGSATSSLLAATALYLTFVLLWISLRRDDVGHVKAAALVAAIAVSVALIVASLAAQAELVSAKAWSWVFLALTMLAITAEQISRAAVYVKQSHVEWNPQWLLAFRAVAAFALIASFPIENTVIDRSLLPQLPSLFSAVIVSLAFSTAIVTAAWLMSGPSLRFGTIIATALPISACLILGIGNLAIALDDESGAVVTRLGFALGSAGWAAAVIIRQLGEWTASLGLVALGYWLLPIAAFGFCAAAISSITKRDIVEIGSVRVPRALTSERAVIASLTVVLATTAISYLVKDNIDLPLLAAFAIACYFAKQALTIKLTGQHVRTILEASEELERAANLDQTTGLPNRTALEARMHEEFERAYRYEQPLSLCVVDVDFFKSVNDRFGHAVGDIVLRTVGKSLRHSARGIDFVGRFGGEEFVVVAPGTWSADAEILAERLREQIDHLIFTSESGESLRVTVSVGVAGYPEHASDLATLFASADGALYQSKQRGRNRVTLHGRDEVD